MSSGQNRPKVFPACRTKRLKGEISKSRGKDNSAEKRTLAKIQQGDIKIIMHNS